MLLKICETSHENTWVRVSFLIKFQAWRPVTLFEKTPTQVFSREVFENFKNIYFEEHLGTTTSERLRKINPLLVLGNAVLDGKRHDWATTAFYWKYEPHEVSLCNIHVIFILTE